MKARAVVITEPNKLEIQEVNLREPSAHDAIVRTAYTSISAGTERMVLAGQMPHPMLQPPVIPGYETVGQVVEVGDALDVSLIGRWVYVGGAQCYDGVNAAWGGQSEQLFVDAERLIHLDGMDPRHGVMLALTATALHGIDLADPMPGDRVLVIGQGPVGQLASRIAMVRGAWVASSDPNTTRLNHAVGDVVINVDDTALQDVVTEPVHTIVEASGSMTALTQALPLLANGGTIVLLGYYQNLEVPYMPLFMKEARLLTSKEWAPGDLERSRDLIADGSLEVESLLTHEIDIADVSQAYDIALNDRNCLKIVINW